VFSRRYLKRTLLGSFVHVVVGFSLYGFINWLPTFFVKAGYSIVTSLQYTTLMALGGPIGAFIGWLSADSIGRRPAIIAASLSAAAFGAIFSFARDGPLQMGVGFGLATSVYVFVAVGFALYVPELFTTKYRMRGTAVCATAGRLVTAVVQFVVIAVFTWGGLKAVLTVLIGLLIVQAGVFAAFGVETKGRPLEQI
jgi:putative MFS transporter